MRPFLSAACALALFPSLANAQAVVRKEAAVFTGGGRAARVQTAPPGMRLRLRQPREFALGGLSAADVAELSAPGPRLKMGIRRALPDHVVATGAWETGADGTRVWRIGLRSPGSRGMRVEFENFAAGSGRVWIHDGVTVDGPYSGRGLYEDGHFWSGAIASSSVIIEYQPGPDAAWELEPPFTIRGLTHQVRSALSSALDLGPDAGAKDPADYCELDVNCYSGWQGAASSVGQISFIDGGNEILCSGALVATRDNSFIPYFLTAGHCINNEAAARTIQAYWTYQTPACGGSAPASRATSLKSSVGGHLMQWGTIAQGDFSLVLLPDVPAGVTFSGWDTGDPPQTTDLTAIHHPSGSWKRISFGNRVGDATNVVAGITAPGELFLQVVWNQGRVEHGSSGSPLFSAPGVLTGSLSYGEVLGDGTVCTIIPSVAGYSRFSNTYGYVQSFLENLPADEVLPGKASLSFTVANHAASAAQSLQLTTQTNGQATYKLRADAPWIQLGAVTGTVSAKTPASVAIGVDAAQLAQPGSYSSTVTIFSGAAPPQSVTVNAVVQVAQSNVNATITPKPVAQFGGRWSFQIQLAETAGAATHVTALKFNGADYSTSIANWFGTNQIAANGTIVAPLSGAGVFPHGDQYVELWGVDDLSGLAWYRVATVTFQ